MDAMLASKVPDPLVPGWRDTRLVSGNRRVAAPYRNDAHPSLDVDEGKLVWFDRGTGAGAASSTSESVITSAPA